jgi:hypothetical protein
MLGKSWHAGCGCPALESLVRLSVSHWDFNGQVSQGVLEVDGAVADELAGAFESLFAARFPIERMQPIHCYDGDDERSMRANNTSAFNCRRKTGKSSLSIHSFGRAIDINPVQNPYENAAGLVLPENGKRFARRSQQAQAHPGLILADGAVVRAFAAIGWAWGGHWDDPKDWQHFQKEQSQKAQGADA